VATIVQNAIRQKFERCRNPFLHCIKSRTLSMKCGMCIHNCGVMTTVMYLSGYDCVAPAIKALLIASFHRGLILDTKWRHLHYVGLVSDWSVCSRKADKSCDQLPFFRGRFIITLLPHFYSKRRSAKSIFSACSRNALLNLVCACSCAFSVCVFQAEQEGGKLD
jgi:hypothetical protein